MERDIQTLLANVSATIHSQDFLRADTWAHAVRHWHRLHNLVPQHPSIKDTPAPIIDPSFRIDAHTQVRHTFGDLLCFPLRDHEGLLKFDVKNTHSTTTHVWMDLPANRSTSAISHTNSQILITSILSNDGETPAQPLQPTLIQHAASPPLPSPKTTTPSSRKATIPIPATQSLRRNPITRAKTQFYKPHDICNVTASLRDILATDCAPPPIFPTDQGDTCDDTSIIYSYAIDTLFDPSYYIGETEEIETKDALTAPDRDKFLRAIQKEIHGKQRP